MFTGIIEEIGTIKRIERGQKSSVLSIAAELIMSDLKIGDSVSVSGVCLTARAVESGGFTADVMHETLNRSVLGRLRVGDSVNLERAMQLNGRFGGHIVAGHADGTGKIENVRRDDNAVWYTISAARELMPYIVEKGSVAIDGISLTVAKVDKSASVFAVSIIPHTMDSTTLAQRKAGDLVNLETDVIGKYVESLLTKSDSTANSDSVTMDLLRKNGFC